MLKRLVLCCCLAVLPQAAAADEVHDAAEIEQIVRDYLLREPEIIYEAIQVLQARQQAAEIDQQRAAVRANASAIFEDPRDPVMGDPAGTVTLVEFFDYRCGYCRSMAPALDGLLEEQTGLRFVLKEFPILGPQSVLAAKAALAADKQGAYEAFHRELMRAQTITEASLEALAQENGLDVERFRADMESDEIAGHIEANYALAQALGINGTPSFVIGDQLLPGAVPAAQLASLIEEERGAGN